MPLMIQKGTVTLTAIAWHTLGIFPPLHQSLRHQACYAWILRFFGIDGETVDERIAGIEKSMRFKTVHHYNMLFMDYLADSLVSNDVTLDDEEECETWNGEFFGLDMDAVFTEAPAFLTILVTYPAGASLDSLHNREFHFIVARQAQRAFLFSPTFGETSVNLFDVGRILRRLIEPSERPYTVVVSSQAFDAVGLTNSTENQYPAQSTTVGSSGRRVLRPRAVNLVGGADSTTGTN